jgi:hypothetical protein
MNPTPKPKKPKSVARTQKKPMKKGGGGRKELPKTHRQPDIPWSTKYRDVRPKNPTVGDVLMAKASYNAELLYDYICEKSNNTREACIKAYRKWQDKRELEKQKQLLLSQYQRVSPLKSPSLSQSRQSSQYIQEELRTTKSTKHVLKPLPRPMLPLPPPPQPLKPLPYPRSSTKK